VDLVEQPAQHLGVRQIQGIFRDNAHRLYHWVENRAVPADNNRAERELRPTVSVAAKKGAILAGETGPGVRLRSGLG